MNASILNRQFKHPKDGWYHLEPAGRHLNRAAGVTQIIDEKAIRSMVTAFNREADEWKARHGTEFPGMLIDHEHFKHNQDKETRAYGWLMELQNRDDGPGPYGRII
jgi:hypothetical protein